MWLHPPRRWQVEAYAAAVKALDAGQSAIIRATMGAGKSLLIAELARHAVDAAQSAVIRASMGERDTFGDMDAVLADRLSRLPGVLITTPTRALVRQLAATLRAAGLDVGEYYSETKSVRPVTVACVDSVSHLFPYEWDLWIADEAHGTECATLLECVELLQPRRRIGLTATPWRASRREELSLWDVVAYDYGPADALADGVLVPWRVVPYTGDAADVDDVCELMIRHAEGPGIISASTIEDAEAYAARLGVLAVHSKLTRAEIDRRLDMLRTGAVRALVHVSLLSEGVDLPWLRWLCLRRPSATRVRFAQEVGRVLRTFPGKTEAVIYDPHDLFGAMGLDYDAVLSGGSIGALPAMRLGPGPIRRVIECPEHIAVWPGARVHVWPARHPSQGWGAAVVGVDGGVTLDVDTDADALELRLCDWTTADERAVAVVGAPTQLEPITEAEAYLRAVTIELEQRGGKRKLAPREWRRMPATDKQRGLLGRLATALAHRADKLPPHHRAALRRCWMARQTMRRGGVSDLITVCLHVVGGREW